MSPALAPARSLTWRLLPWLIPISLILVGLVFVAAGLSDAGEPTEQSDGQGPENVRAVISESALSWAVGQVGNGVTTEVDDVIVVAPSATGASTYTTRSVIVRRDSTAIGAPAPGETAPTLAEADKSTVATCVLWDVDVTNRTALARAAVEVRREVGHHDLGEDSALSDACRAVTFPG